MLKVQDLRVSYGNAEAVHGISLEVAAGELVTLIGGNGAGKSTTLMTIAGLIRPTSGTVEYNGKQIKQDSPDQVIKAGISLCPEGRRVFPEMKVLENLELGAYSNPKQMKEGLENCYEMFPRLYERRQQPAGTLSGGEQQMLAIARALMCGPTLVMFDEPSMGLAPNLVERVADAIMKINLQGTTVLLVEQNAFMALSMATRAYVMETGNISMQGDAQKMMDDEHVQKAYLGG